MKDQILNYVMFSFRSPERQIRTLSGFKATLQDLRTCVSTFHPAFGAYVKGK